jgi:hypothetical protein
MKPENMSHNEENSQPQQTFCVKINKLILKLCGHAKGLQWPK